MLINKEELIELFKEEIEYQKEHGFYRTEIDGLEYGLDLVERFKSSWIQTSKRQPKERLTFFDGHKNYCYDPIDIVDNDYSNINFQKIVDKLAEYEDNNEWIPFTFNGDGLNCRLPDEDEEIRK